MRIAMIALAALAATACSRTVKVQTDPATGHADVDVGRPGANEDWSGTLSPVGGSGVSGTARGTSGHDMTMVTVSVTGAQPGARLPWHVHEGRCGQGSPPIVGPASAYPVMTVGADGRATAQAHLNMDLNEAKSYIVNVHASPTNLGTIVSCGDFDD
ncbi:hypothetical protein SAMN05216486_1099 [bacterium JGI 053]|nr:hypothetical protein SAMN05216486_1099 [bacterium JGI 053]